MLKNAQIDEFKAKVQTKMLELAFKQATAVLNDDYECTKEHQCLYRFLSIYSSIFNSPLYNYTPSEEEGMVNWISAVAGLEDVVPISFTNYTIIQFGSGSGSVEISDITYAKLVDKITNSELIPGSSYRITDYSTKHKINNTNIINEGSIEPLVVRANSNNVLDSDVYSSSYPLDILRYDINNNRCEDGVTPRNGFITYRKDTVLNNEVIGYDFRVVKFKKGRAVADIWSASITYNEGAIIKYFIGGDYQYYILTKTNVPAGTVPLASPAIDDAWDFLFKETDNFYTADGFQYWIYRGGYLFNPYQLTVSSTDVKYFYTFNALGHDASNGNYSEFKGFDNSINNGVTNDGLTFFCTNNGSGIYNNKSLRLGNQSTFHSDKVNNNNFDSLALGLFFPKCDIYENFINQYNCIFKGIFCRNTVVSSYLNYYGGNCTDNWTAVYSNQNIIKANFQSNKVSIASCIIGSGFSNNTIAGTGDSFYDSSCKNIVANFNINNLGTLTVPIKLNSVVFNQPVSGLTTNAGVTLTRVVFDSAITNKKILSNQTDSTVQASSDGVLWAMTIQNSTGSLVTTPIS